MVWNNTSKLKSKVYKCGYCIKEIASTEGYQATSERQDRIQGRYNTIDGSVYICHHCENPTYFNNEGHQFRGKIFGEKVDFIADPLVGELYEEARKCHSFNAYNPSVMCCRKVLMNLSVSEGAEEGISFKKYIDYLKEKGFIPPNRERMGGFN